MTAAVRWDVETARAIERAVLDYFEGWYDGDVERMRRALHPELVKRRGGEQLGVTSAEQMIAWTAEGKGHADGADRRIEVEIADVHDGIATAIVRSAPYREYVHLVRTHAGWKIANALWLPS